MCARTMRIALALLAVCACEDRGGEPRSSLESTWPSDDGRFWTYQLVASLWAGDPGLPDFVLPDEALFPTREEVPPAPTFAVAAAILADLPTREPAEVTEHSYALHFLGSALTPSGGTAQNLVESVDGVPVLAAAAAAHPLLARLARARPDLQPALAGLEVAAPTLTSVRSLILHGGVWEKTASYIGTYGVVDLDLAWKYLEAELTPGHEFAFQLVKPLADDVFLHARVMGRVTVENDAGRFEQALDVVYVIDYGVSEAVNSDGKMLGFFRASSIGRIVYADGVGPVLAEERGLYFAGSDEAALPLDILAIDLVATGSTR